MAKSTAAKDKKTPGTAVAPVERGGALVDEQTASMFMEDAQNLQSQFNRDDLAIPFLRILQKGSPEVNKRDDKYVEGAEAGMFFNTLTKELWDGNEGLYAIPAAYTPSYTEWWPRDSKLGTGFVRDHGADSSCLNRTHRDEKTNKDMTDEGTEIVRAGQYYLLVIDPETGDTQQVVYAASGTQLKKSRQWNSLIKNLLVPRPGGAGKFNPAPFYLSYRLTSVYESNDKGDWMGVAISPAKPTIEYPGGVDVYQQARNFAQMINEGRVKVQPIEDAEIVTEGHEKGAF